MSEDGLVPRGQRCYPFPRARGLTSTGKKGADLIATRRRLHPLHELRNRHLKTDGQYLDGPKAGFLASILQLADVDAAKP